ncbi:MAG: energy transducer TonB [Zoogloeaceae bacterium]|nr:energy transducer TonB [Zoogloeaceae bacterium]
MPRGTRDATLWLGIALAHVGVLCLLMRPLSVSAPQWRQPVTLAVMFSPAAAAPAPPAPPVPAAPEPPAVQPRVRVRPVLAAPPRAKAVSTPVEEVAQPVPVEAPAESSEFAPSAPSAPSGAAVSGVAGAATELPRFDADYLDNPKPPYPAFSRRMGESGRVLLRVFVEANGRASRVELKKSSGFARLDEAAQTVLYRWRFIPARRIENGVQHAVSAWVVVPITFKLE